MGPKNPHAGMPPRNLPDKPGSFANAWEDSCPMKWKFGPKTCLVLFESSYEIDENFLGGLHFWDRLYPN